MTFRGTVINGVVIPDSGLSLPEGTRVTLSPLPPASAGRKPPIESPPALRKKRRASAARRKKTDGGPHPLIALAGIWKDRADWKGKSSVEVVAELRRPAPERRRG